MKHKFKPFATHDNGKEIFRCEVCKTKSMVQLNTECKPSVLSNTPKKGNHFIFQKPEIRSRIKY